MAKDQQQEAVPVEVPRASHVYVAIDKIAEALGKVGIEKSHRAPDVIGKFMFRGIDDVLNALSPLLVTHGVRILAKDMERTTVQAGKGYVATVKVLYEITALRDGSSTTVVAIGDGYDTSDKATSKAISSAYKSMVFQTFVVPTEASIDSEASGDEPGEEPARGNKDHVQSPKEEGEVKREPPSKALLKMLREAIGKKGDAALKLVDEFREKYDAEKAEDLPKAAAAELLRKVNELK